jgi:serine/threonine protein kinase
MFGCFELLLLLGMIAALLVLMGRYPAFAKKLHQLLRSPRVSGWKLLAGAIFFGFLALVLSTKLHKPGHPNAKLLFPLFLSAAIALFIWSMLRFRGLYLPDAAAIDRPPARDKDLPSEPSILAELGRLMAETSLLGGLGRLIRAIAVRVSRLSRFSNKDLLLVSFLLVGLPFPFFLEDAKPCPNEWPEVVILFFFWWAVCFLALCPIRWLLRKITRSACPSIGHLKDLLAERLPAEERSRLTAHLELCPVCQQRVEGLSMGHNSWPGLARKLSDRPAEPEPALRKVMQKLRENAEETTDNEPALAGDLPLGFLSPSDKPGQLGRLERYEVLEEIGRGGMGVVLKAFDPSLHRVVAIKVLAPQLATSGVARKRFLREAKAAAAVTHDHIVTIHAVDETNGLPYLVMQYVAGQSLQDRIDKEGPLELTDILRIGMQTASGLAAAHAHGIVHRDIKPANILLEEGVQRVKITDFGLARAMDDASLTQSGFVAGSPLYMAPEQARGEALDQRADLFSLGSVLYTMCTGRPPFRAANTLAVLRRVSEDRPRPIRETNPEVPDWLTDIVDKLMAKDPAERFQSAAEVEEVLGRHLAQLQHAAWTPPPRSPAPAGTNSDVLDLPTSLTICPNCGANLHVPEQMVGSLVHCAECGKPFQVEQGSEVMQVARPVRWPLRRRFCSRRKFPGCIGCIGIAAVGSALLLLLSILYMSLGYESVLEKPASRAARQADQSSPNEPPPWKCMLEWLPAEATLFGAIDLKPFGSLTLDDPTTQAILRLVVPKEAAGKLTPENLGRIQIHGAALACYDNPKSRTNQAIVLLEGKAWSGRKRILDFIRQQQTDKIHVKESVKVLQGLSGKSALISGPAFPFAIHLRDDEHVFLASPLSKDATEGQNLKALERLPEVGARPNIYLFSDGHLSGHGYNPPWIYEALGKIPMDACGAFLGEIPAVWRKALTDALQLRVCPRTFVFHVRRENQDIAISLTLNLDKADADRTLKEDLEKWRQQGLKTLQTNFPALKSAPQGSALLGQILNNMHWNTSGGSVQTQVRISDPTWKALGEALTRLSRTYANERR